MSRLPALALLCAALAIPLTANAGSDEQRRRTTAGILGAAIVGGAILNNENKKDKQQRGYVSRTEVNACADYANDFVHRRGGYGYEVYKVRATDTRGETHTLYLDGVSHFRNDRRDVTFMCRVSGNDVVAFK